MKTKPDTDTRKNEEEPARYRVRDNNTNTDTREDSAKPETPTPQSDLASARPDNVVTLMNEMLAALSADDDVKYWSAFERFTALHQRLLAEAARLVSAVETVVAQSTDDGSKKESVAPSASTAAEETEY